MPDSTKTQYIHDLALWMYNKLLQSPDKWYRDGYLWTLHNGYLWTLHKDYIPVTNITDAAQHLDRMGLISSYQYGGSEYYRARVATDIAQGIHRLRRDSSGRMYVYPKTIIPH